MPTMKSVRTGAPGRIEVAEIQRPVPGPRDLLVRVRACGICGTDAAFVQMGGMPLGPEGKTASIPLGHEPAGHRHLHRRGRRRRCRQHRAAGRQVGRPAGHRRGAQKTRAHRPGLNAAQRGEHHRIPGLPHRDLEVTPQIAEHQQRFSRLISHHVPFSDAGRAFQLALTPGAAEKVIVTFSA